MQAICDSSDLKVRVFFVEVKDPLTSGEDASYYQGTTHRLGDTMIKHRCPLCGVEMMKESFVIYHDYICNIGDHFYSERAVTENAISKVIKVKLFVTDTSGEKFYLKINYDEGNCQVWKRDSNSPRKTINSILVPNYNMYKLLLQIKENL
jgi:hypothetical protein